MCQRPPVERTIESPMARPRPAPLLARGDDPTPAPGGTHPPGPPLRGPVEPVEQARPFGFTNARTAVLHGQADPVALSADLDPDLPVRAGVPAGIVDQDPGQPVDPFRRRADQHGIVRGLRADRGTDGTEPVRAGLRQRRQVDGLVTGRRRPGVEPGQPEHVIDQLPQSLALALDPHQRVAVLGGLPRSGQGHVGFRPDHAEGGAQFVGGIGGELKLAAPRLLDGSQRPQAHDQRAEEHREQQERPGDDLGVQQQPPGVRVAGLALARDQPAAAIRRHLQPERTHPAQARGEREPVAGAVPGEQGRGQDGRTGAVPGDHPARVRGPQEYRGAVGVDVATRLAGRADPGHSLVERRRILPDHGQAAGQPLVVLLGQVPGDHQVEHDHADDVDARDDSRRDGGDLGRGAGSHAVLVLMRSWFSCGPGSHAVLVLMGSWFSCGLVLMPDAYTGVIR